ncbi:drug/metabolite exporter YedA [Cytophagales bacterium WSM2-2]|nr:drug/metabolite exporter YedA [Cytophagales bacterium WSM2-2]
MENNKNLKAFLALGAVCILWGTTYLALRVGVTQFPPFLFSFLRFAIAGPLLIGILLVLGKKIPSRQVMMNQALGGLMMCTLGVSVVGWAEVNVSSGVAAIICSMMPIWTVLINLFANKEEKPTPMVIIGLLVGLSGIILIFSEHIIEFYKPEYTNGIIAIFLANLCWAIGTYAMKKKNTGTDPFMNAGLQMFFGALFLAPISLAFDDYSTVQWTNETVFALLYLALVGSVAAFACYSYALGKLPMTIVSLYAYINPVIAVILGWVILSEKLNTKIWMAIVITLLGVYLVNKGYQLRKEWRAQLSKS